MLLISVLSELEQIDYSYAIMQDGRGRKRY